MTPRTLAIACLIAAAAASRLLPHPPNVAPIAAMALFGGARLDGRRTAFAVPLAAMLLSDLAIGFHVVQPVVYALFAATVALGRLLRGRRGAAPIAAATLLASILFFAGSNLAVWLLQPLYPRTAAGLLECFAAALPFFRNTLLGDAAYAAALFGGMALAERRFPALQRAPGGAMASARARAAQR